ncbi:efflux RND transporter periplasmic adaptor subunit [Marinivivus vitaminiproducens]|uniref:efflux RND transporter periplasmic adaptor subunit n=1 Tax=Marinivivus vitaminiproducens TaxID=3035935 RepID=UPI0027A1F9D4|nr:HlyD family secretion protein [Geminicoccaceae bacterium SCSIO 64248]
MRFVSLLPRLLATLVIVGIAAALGWYLWDYYMREPWTRDGRVRADVVRVAPDVSGIVGAIHVVDNQWVAAGDPLFTIDRDRFRIAVEQAEASARSRRAEMEQAQRDSDRLAHLNDMASSVQAREQAASTAEMAAAAYQRALADLDLANLNLERTEVRASVDGYVNNLTLRVGDYVDAGEAVLPLIDAHSFYVAGYFEETKLPRIAPGAPVRIALMGVGPELWGHVDSVATGIVDRERGRGDNLLPDVNPTFNWVRLAQRLPVRIAIDCVPDGVRLAGGLTATVRVLAAERADEPLPAGCSPPDRHAAPD